MTMLRSLLPGLLCCLLLSAGSVAAAQEPAFEIRQASLQKQAGGYYLNALIDIHLPGYIREAFDQGFDLPLILEIEVLRKRRWWLWDKQLHELTQRYRLRYRSLSDTVRVLDLKTGEHRYYDDLQDALAALSVIFNRLLLERDALEPGERYRLRMRFGIDQAELPIPLKSSSLWQNDWNLSSDWYEWDYQP